MNKGCCFLVAAVIAITPSLVLAYGGGQHTKIARYSLQPLERYDAKVADFCKNNLDTAEIFKSASEPDNIPFPDPDFVKKINGALDNLITKYLSDIPFGNFTREKLKVYLKKGLLYASDAYSNEFSDLQSGTQHSYVFDPSINAAGRNKTLNALGDVFSSVCIAPVMAQKEYDLAIAYWKAGNKKEAAHYLGRVFHYLQDVTVPHHTEIPGNLTDVFHGLKNVLDGKDMQEGNSQSVFEENKSDTFMTRPTFLTQWMPKWHADGTFSITPAQVSTPVSSIVRHIRNQVFLGNYMDKVNAINNYNRGSYRPKNTYVQVFPFPIYGPPGYGSLDQFARWKVYPDYVHTVGGSSGDCTYPFKKSSGCNQSIDVNDDMMSVLAVTLPLAIKAGATILAKFHADINSPFYKKAREYDPASFDLKTVFEPVIRSENNRIVAQVPSNLSGNAHVTIYRMDGRLVSKTCVKDVTVIDGLQRGQYISVLSFQDGRITQRHLIH